MPSLTPLAAKWNAATISFNTRFREVYEAEPTFYEKIATVMPSDTREEDYAWLDRLPQMREWLGERVVNSPSIRMQQLVNKLYESTVGVRRTDIADDKIGVYRPLIEELARSSKIHPDVVVAAAMQSGHTSVVYDGQYFFDTDHPVNMDNANVLGPGGTATQANLLTSHALSAENLEDAIQTMMAWVGSDGKPLGIIPDTLIVPPQLKFKAARLLQAELLGSDISLAVTSTSTQGHGAAAQSNVLRGSLDLMVLPYLASDATSFYVACTKRAIKPFIFQQREAAEFAALTRPDDEHVFKHDEFLYGARCRDVAGYGPWFLAAKCTA